MRSAILLAALTASPIWAADAPYWPELSAEIFGQRMLLDGADVIAVDAPYRTGDDARTQIAARIAAPEDTTLAKVSLILDENPMPLSAVFAFDEPLPRFFFDVTMRVNGPTPVHVVAEMSDGRTFVAETFVKTSGLGACAAPPGTDPEEALASLGQMEIGVGELPFGEGPGDLLAALEAPDMKVDVTVSHPSHSGMQMDQISLLYIPMRYVERLDVDLDGAGYVDMTGSISLSENPTVSLSVPKATQSVDVTMTDTEGSESRAHLDLPGY